LCYCDGRVSGKDYRGSNRAEYRGGKGAAHEVRLYLESAVMTVE